MNNNIHLVSEKRNYFFIAKTVTIQFLLAPIRSQEKITTLIMIFYYNLRFAIISGTICYLEHIARVQQFFD